MFKMPNADKGVEKVLGQPFASRLSHDTTDPFTQLIRYNFDEYEFQRNMEVLRNREGLGVPLKYNMDRHLARQVGRLPFLPSSNLMDDVLTGRINSIGFADFMNLPENREHHFKPSDVLKQHGYF